MSENINEHCQVKKPNNEGFCNKYLSYQISLDCLCKAGNATLRVLLNDTLLLHMKTLCSDTLNTVVSKVEEIVNTLVF